MRPEFVALAEEMQRARGVGVVTVAVITHGAGPSEGELDRFVQGLGLLPLGPGWLPLSRTQAATLIHQLLRFDLAYSGSAASEEQATALATRFLSLFAPDVRCYTNGTWLDGARPTGPSTAVGPSWTPLTDATFDAGVVCVDADLIGLFLVQDED